jgi:hypothetical protein
MTEVLVALRLIAHRASLNGRDEITLDDIEWAIQQIEHETPIMQKAAGKRDEVRS